MQAKLDPQHWDIVLQSLGKQPLEAVFQPYLNLVAQLAPQVLQGVLAQYAPPPPPAEPTPTPTAPADAPAQG